MNKQIQIPLYLQKSIIKIICNHLNKENKILTEFLDGDIGGLDYRQREKESKLFMINTALVSSNWFKSCSNYLNVSVDFNFSDSPYSIIKPDNIKTIKLHYDHKESHKKFYKMKNGKRFDIDDPIRQVYEIIRNNRSITKILIRNINFVHDDFLELVKTLVRQLPRNYGGDDWSIESFGFLTYGISPNTTLDILKEHKDHNLKSVAKLCIMDIKDKNIFQNVFKMWSKSIKHIEIDLNEIDYGNILSQSKFFQTITNDRYLTNLQNLNICMMDVTLIDLSSILDNCKLLSNLSFNFCFNSILHYLTPSIGRTKEIETACSCDSLVEYSQNDRDVQFTNDWDNLIKSFKKSIHLNQIEFGQNCNINDANILWETGKPFPASVNSGIASLILSIPNLTILYFYGSTTSPDIFYEIASKNKSIIHFKSCFNDIDCDSLQYKNGVELILNQFSHISTFKLIRLLDIDETILNYSK